ncbi:MAG: glucuronate isomerase [Cyclobacteriaceae bacterium]|nr:glucuronate isomerase [Cyclobacteriaceae bacterium]
MVEKFINSNWLLFNKISRHLYHEVVSQMPIIDYHNHLNPHFLAANKQFENLTDLWIREDPYKHRAMRINGIDEAGITGNSTDKEKFLNWVSTYPKTIGNPLFHWSALELERTFGISEMLNSENAGRIWNQCNEMLQDEEFRMQNIVGKWNVELLCTSDNVLDDLSAHDYVNQLNTGFDLLPSLRADSLLNYEDGFLHSFIQQMEECTRLSIHSIEDFLQAIILRLDYFKDHGCCLSDHGLDAGFEYIKTDQDTASLIFDKLMSSQIISDTESVQLRSFMLLFLGREYAKRQWIMQLHIGAHRKTSTRLRKLVGPAGGFACIGNTCNVDSLTKYFDELECHNLLPQIILYTLNPADNAVFASITGSYAEDGIMGKIQFGPAWWYNDHYDGLRKHLTDLASTGLLGTFIGMTTDSRSVLSLSRHEYFRRILCNLMGEWAENGLIPADLDLLSQLIKDIAYNNIKLKLTKNSKKWQKAIKEAK